MFKVTSNLKSKSTGCHQGVSRGQCNSLARKISSNVYPTRKNCVNTRRTANNNK